jgi:hypothetical protein
VLGLSITDGYIAYNITYSELTQMNSNEIFTNKYALEGPSGITQPYEPLEEKPIDYENITLKDFIKMSDKGEDYLKHMKVFELLKNTEEAIEWLQDHANLIGMIFIAYFMIIVLVIYFKSGKKSDEFDMHNVPNENVLNESVNNSHESESVPINRAPPHSMKHGPIDKLQTDIPLFSLDKSEMSMNDNFDNPRKISNFSRFTHNPETGSLEMHDTVSNSKRFTPNIESTIGMNFSANPSFSKQLTNKGKFREKQIIEEENSSSISPDTSFKKARSSFATHSEKYVHESYYAKGGEFIIEENQRKVTRFPDTPIFRHIVSESLKRKDPNIIDIPTQDNTLSFALKRSEKPTLLKIDENKNLQDFEDDSFKNIKFGRKSSPTKDFLTRVNR